MESRATRAALGVWTVLVVLFLWVPLAVMALYLVAARRAGAFESL